MVKEQLFFFSQNVMCLSIYIYQPAMGIHSLVYSNATTAQTAVLFTPDVVKEHFKRGITLVTLGLLRLYIAFLSIYSFRVKCSAIQKI